MTTARRILGVALVLGGLAAFLWPDVSRLWETWQQRQAIAAFQERYGAAAGQVVDQAGERSAGQAAGGLGADADCEPGAEGILGQESGPDEPAKPGAPTEPGAPAESDAPADAGVDAGLRQAIEAYNESLRVSGQAGLADAWSYEQNPMGVQIADDLFGYVEVPSMGVTLPLYLGATYDNMARGAALLGQTSVPVGGAGTNAVIVGHRGWYGGPYFLNIEDVRIGDEVLVANPWETLRYEVFAIAVIEPTDRDAVLIVPDADLVTLVTCHPYMSNGRYRYVVYCKREGTAVPRLDVDAVDGQFASAPVGAVELGETDGETDTAGAGEGVGDAEDAAGSAGGAGGGESAGSDGGAAGAGADGDGAADEGTGGGVAGLVSAAGRAVGAAIGALGMEGGESGAGLELAESSRLAIVLDTAVRPVGGVVIVALLAVLLFRRRKN